MELMNGGPLTDLIKQRKAEGNGFTDEESAQVMKCIFAAMEYMHSHNIVHRDLKPGKFKPTINLTFHIDNILIGDYSDLSTVKVADFGLSAKYE